MARKALLTLPVSATLATGILTTRNSVRISMGQNAENCQNGR